MSPPIIALSAGLLSIAAPLSLVDQGALPISEFLAAPVLPAITFVYVLMTFYRFCGAAR